ncbi:MAG: phage antirepressor KilAC domain-containing protein [Sarcina sp.]
MEIAIRKQNGVNVVSSRVVAEQLKKEHSDVMRKVKEILGVGEFSESSYINSQNKVQPELLLTKDGFILLCMNYQGYNEFKRAYINEFNRMEKELYDQFKVPTTMKEALLLALEQQEQIEKLEAKQLEDKPKVEFYNDVTESKDTIDMATVAKVLNIKNVGRNKLFEILRDKKVLMQNNQPYQKYIDNGWFRQIESKWTKPNGDIGINIKTVVFQKGVNGIRKIIGDYNGI